MLWSWPSWSLQCNFQGKHWVKHRTIELGQNELCLGWRICCFEPKEQATRHDQFPEGSLLVCSERWGLGQQVTSRVNICLVHFKCKCTSSTVVLGAIHTWLQAHSWRSAFTLKTHNSLLLSQLLGNFNSHVSLLFLQVGAPFPRVFNSHLPLLLLHIGVPSPRILSSHLSMLFLQVGVPSPRIFSSHLSLLLLHIVVPSTRIFNSHLSLLFRQVGMDLLPHISRLEVCVSLSTCKTHNYLLLSQLLGNFNSRFFAFSAGGHGFSASHSQPRHLWFAFWWVCWVGRMRMGSTLLA
jgi:hypothetical protein